MRILHLDSGYEMRGGQHQALFLCDGQRLAGHQVTLLARPSGPLYERARARNISVFAWGPMALLAHQSAADLIHVHDSHSHTIAAVLGRRPVVVSRRVAFMPSTSAFSRWKYQRAERYIAVSRYVAAQLRRAGIGEDRIRIVHDGVPEMPASLLGRQVLAFHSDDPLKLGSLAEAAAQKAGVTLRYIRNLEEDLSEAALLLYLSESEGLGSGALLAQAAGVPVVASRVGGLVEAVEDGFTGLLVKNELDAVAGAIRAILDDPITATRFRSNARERIQRSFAVDHMVRETIAAYKGLLS
jgi:hypothetical protein